MSHTLTNFVFFLAAFSSDSVFHKEKDDRNLRLLDNHHIETTETTIEGNFCITLHLVMAAVNSKVWHFGVSHRVVW